MFILGALLRKTWNSLRARQQVQNELPQRGPAEGPARDSQPAGGVRLPGVGDCGTQRVLQVHGAVRVRGGVRAGRAKRAILRMSKDVSGLRRAWILIDGVEAGLHPWTPQQLMRELPRIALRDDLQVVVTTRSWVVLDSVPPEGRIFLERDAGTLDVRRMPAWRDIFQKALYGQSADRLSILYEEEVVAEGVVLGAREVLNYGNGTRRDDFVVGRDTGSKEFRGHKHAFGKFGKLAGFVFLLDGDAADRAPALIEAASQYGHKLEPLFLPGRSAPEAWIWNAVRDRPEEYAREYGLTVQDLRGRLASIEQTFRQRRDDPFAGRAEGESAGPGRQVDADHAGDRADWRPAGSRGGPRRDGRVQRRAHGAERYMAAGRRPLMAGYPRIPYGVANFRRLRLERRLYVDKTRFLHALEQVDHAVLMRPRRFGKICWVSLLEHYYDRSWAHEFDAVFGGTDVGRQPTEHGHSYVVLRFNFSAFKTALDGLEHHFEEYCQLRLRNALERNPDLFPEAAVRRIRAPAFVNGQLNELFAYASDRDVPLYALIDEYDNFANTVLAHHGDAAYQRFTHGGGFYPNFFATLKAGTEAVSDGPGHEQGRA